MIQRRLYLVAASITLIAVCVTGCHRTVWHTPGPVAPQQPGQLELRLVGEHLNQIEADFDNQGIPTIIHDTINPPPGDNEPLTFGKTIVFPENNQNGNFAVIYRKPQPLVRAFGWQPGKNDIKTQDVQPVGRLVGVDWVSPLVLRVKSRGPDSHVNVQQIEFVPVGDQAWKPLP